MCLKKKIKFSTKHYIFSSTSTSIFTFNFNSNGWHGMRDIYISECALQKCYWLTSLNSAWFRRYLAFSGKKKLWGKKGEKKVVFGKKNKKHHVSWTKQNWDVHSRDNFLGKIPPNNIVSYHVIIRNHPPWRKMTLKLSFASLGPRDNFQKFISLKY